VIALDTNVVVRLLVDDDREQTRRARAMILHQDVSISPTVLLETEWVLRSAYQLSREEILKPLRTLLGLRGLQIDNMTGVIQALADYAAGLDFADALHLAFADRADSFATFDKTLVRRANKFGRSNVVEI
jgi:predicted nucleic-acid-binding protein